MSKKHRYTGITRNGKPHFDDRVGFLNDLSGREDREWAVTVTGGRNVRSSDANAYWRGIVVAIAALYFEATGQYDYMDNDRAHEILKARFLPPRAIKQPDGIQTAATPKTRDLTVKEFSELTEKATAWLSMFFDIEWPDPDQHIQTYLRQLRRELIPQELTTA